jgi:hypothetical protein
MPPTFTSSKLTKDIRHSNNNVSPFIFEVIGSLFLFFIGIYIAKTIFNLKFLGVINRCHNIFPFQALH